MRKAYYYGGGGKILSRDRQRKKRYNLTPEQIRERLVSQGNSCAICSTEINLVNLHVDHDHETGKVRGLLCRSCNLALGMICDDPSKASGLASYLSHHKITNAMDVLFSAAREVANTLEREVSL